MLQNRFTGLFLLYDLGVGSTQNLNTGIQLRLPLLLSKNLIWTDVPRRRGISSPWFTPASHFRCPSEPEIPRGRRQSGIQLSCGDRRAAGGWFKRTPGDFCVPLCPLGASGGCWSRKDRT